MHREDSNRLVARWLFLLCGMIFLMVVLGGVTRLTGSGLSMVDWRPVTGFLPPLSAEAWEDEFAAYRASPEFEQVNFRMDLEDFKGIYWLEYLHRLLGRLIGIAFLLPFAWFIWKGHIPGRDWPRYLLMFVLGGLQGLLGWYMVKSGLIADPRVSQYRLVAHLVAAFAIYAYIFWMALSLLHARPDTSAHPWFGRTVALTALIALTVISGGFVAGLDAGLVFNTFPMMAGRWLPPGYFALDPAWRNPFENMAAVQFNHRVLALTTFCAVAAWWWHARQADMPRRLKAAATALLHTAVLQVVLGISTLVMMVPVALGAAHQATALLLFTVALFLCHGLRHVRAGR